MKTPSPRMLWKIIKCSFGDFSANRISSLSAALAYYTIFSLPGMLIIITTLGNVFYGRQAVEGSIQAQITGFVGPVAAAQIQEIIRGAAISSKSTLAAVVGIITLVYGATKMFGEIQDSLNHIWNLKPKPKRGWVRYLINRLISFSMVVTLGFLLLVSLVVDGIVAAFSHHLAAYFPQITISLVYVFNLALTFVITSVLFAVIFKVLPDAKVRWKDISVGALATAFLFMVGKFVIGYYLGTSHVSSAYGAAGSIIVVLLWIYYCAMILYFGAAFTKEYAQHMGLPIYPTNAVWVKQVELDEHQPLDQLEKADEEGRIKPVVLRQADPDKKDQKS